MPAIAVNPDLSEESPENDEVVYLSGMKDEDFLRRLVEKLPDQIAEGIAKGLQGQPVQSEPAKGWQAKLGPAASLLVIAGGLLAAMNYMISSSITTALVQPGQDIVKLQTQVTEIQKGLDRLLDQQAKATLGNPLEPAAVPSKATEVKDAAVRARERNIPNIARNNLTETGQTILDVGIKAPSIPDVWPALSEVVNYRTQIDKGSDPIALVRDGTIKPCSLSPPSVYGRGTQREGGGTDYVQEGPFGWENCYLRLDDPNLPPVMRVSIQCRNCIVEYRGGPLQVKRAELRNCFFIFRLDSKPADPGLLLVREVLKDSSSVTVG